MASKHRRARVTRFLLLVLVSLPLVGCQFLPQGTPTPVGEKGLRVAPYAYKVTQVKETSMGGILAYSGDVKASTQVAVSAKMSGRIEELRVDTGSEVKAGDVIAVLERSALDAQVKQAEAALGVAKANLAKLEAGPRAETVASAEVALDSAQQKLAAAKAGSRAELIAQAEANLKGAEAKLAQLLAGPTQEQIEVAKTNVRLAKNNLYSIQTQADAYAGSRAAYMGAIVYTQGMKEAQSGVGYEQVQLAEAQLAALMAKPTPEQIAQARSAVDAARESLKLAKDPYTQWDLATIENSVRAAEEQLKLARSPYTPEDINVARAQVKQAEAALDAAKTLLADTVVVAPIDGVVSERLLSVGSMASPAAGAAAAPIITLISPENEVHISVEEARSGALKVGLPARVQVSAFPGQEFQGTVISLAPTVDPRSRTLLVKVRVKDDDRQLKPGMYARVIIDAGQSQTGLVVPKEAVAKRGERDVVFLVVDGRAVMREVRPGPADASNIQILQGVAAGETVVQNPGSTLQEGDAVTP